MSEGESIFESKNSIVFDNVSVSYNKDFIIKNMSINFLPQKITSIVGANGCGKSTLLHTAGKILKPKSGKVTLENKNLHNISSKILSKKMALLPQRPIAPDGVIVEDLVMRGRYPYQSWLGKPSLRDYEIVEHVLDVTDTKYLHNRMVSDLSGGQQQRVWIALVLAQEPDILLLDEPTTFLDLAHQIEVLDLIIDLNTHLGTTIIMVLHDLNLASRYSDEIILLKEGKIVATGKPGEVFSENNIMKAFNLEVKVIIDPVSKSPLLIPVGKYSKKF